MKNLYLLMTFLVSLSGCAYQGGYSPTYLPNEKPHYLSASEVLLVMPDEEEDYVFKGNPSSFTGSITSLTLPLGYILKEVAEEILEDRFSGGVDFANDFIDSQNYLIALHPSIQHFDYRYNQLRNLGFAITPEIEVNIRVEILDENGSTIFDQEYKSGYVSGESYIISGSPSEKINKTLHRTLYDLLTQSFADARPRVQKIVNTEHMKDKNPGKQER